METFDTFSQINSFKLETIGDKIRQLRESMDLPLRKVAAQLDIDQAVLSKIERGIRKASKAQIQRLAKIFNVSEEELLIEYYSEKFVAELAGENFADKALKVAGAKIDYIKKNKKNKK